LQAAARERSVAAKCLNLAESGVVRLCLNWEVLAEAEDVLNRLEIRARFTEFSDEIVGAFLKRLQKISALIRSVSKKCSYPRDEDDEPYITLAVAVGADFIIGRDKDLLDLITGHADDCKEFSTTIRTAQGHRAG
jgi:putative PIN family toxin of toxin-antitoxin system